MRRAYGLIAFAVIALTAACASTGGTAGPSASQSALASAATQAARPVTSPSPAGTTHAYIASGMEKSLPGIVADDGSVLTKAACKPATVKRNPNGSYTVTCVATYSDGSQWRGYGTLLNGKVYFQPVTEVR